VTPWRFPSVVWALICFAIGPIGLVVELVAEVTTRPRLPSTLGRISPRFDSGVRPPATRTMPSSVAPVRPPTEARPVVREPTGPLTPKAADGTTANFGWYADPAGRHALRYFDGRRWSDLVADDGGRSNDPL
jgi:hypothetical protein